MKISIIIPNYNGAELLKKNLPKVFDAISSYKDGAIEVIIIDDYSTDNSLMEIQSFVKIQDENAKTKSQFRQGGIKLKSIRNEKNLGFSSTINKGVREADGEIVVLLNTDVIPERTFLPPLLSHFKNDEVFAVGCMDKSIEEKKVVLRGRGVGAWKRGFLVHSRGEIGKANTLWVSGGSGAFRKSIWEKLGGFDSLYNPFYYEDIDLSYRAQKSGYKVLFESESPVIHEHEKGAIKSTYSRSQIRAIAYRNQFIFVWKNATDLDLQILHIFWLPYHFMKALINNDWMFFRGFINAFLLLPKIIASSFKSRKLFIKKDSEIIKSLS
ncbi:MAG: glycosyltransferase [Candidatus Levybacteria bacterium]|nr:glycosyltransferase [Candidatus Levybacteria bacterium]